MLRVLSNKGHDSVTLSRALPVGTPASKETWEQVSFFKAVFGTEVCFFRILDLLEVWEGPPGSGVLSTGDRAL